MIKKLLKKLLAPIMREVIKEWENEVIETMSRLVRDSRDVRQ